MATDNPDDANFSFEESPDLWLFTSLTAGSSHIITATSRMETILKANRVPFRAIDTATNEKARKIWGRRSQGKRLPGLVKEGWVLCDLVLLEEWNEYGETKENLGAAAPMASVVPPSQRPPPEGENVTNVKTPVAPSVSTKDADARTSTETTSQQSSISAQLASEVAAAAIAKKSTIKFPDAAPEKKAEEGQAKSAEDAIVAEPESVDEDSKSAQVEPLNIPAKAETDGPRRDSYVKGDPALHASFEDKPPSASSERSRASSRAAPSATSSPPTGTASASLAFPVLKRSDKSLEKGIPASAAAAVVAGGVTGAESKVEGPAEPKADSAVEPKVEPPTQPDAPVEEQVAARTEMDVGAQPAAKSGLEAVSLDPQALVTEKEEAEKEKETSPGVPADEEGRAPPPKLEITTDQVEPPLTMQTKTDEPPKAASPPADAREVSQGEESSKTEPTGTVADTKASGATAETEAASATTETETLNVDAAATKASAVEPTAAEEAKQEAQAEGEAKEPEDAGKSVGD